MRKILLVAVAFAGLAAAVAPASARVHHPVRTQHSYVGQTYTDPDAFIRDYERSDPPGAHWGE